MEDKKVILVVDDDAENIDVLVGILNKSYKVKAATSGAKAVKSCQKKAPDLVLLDIMMPEMDGYQVFEQLKADASTSNIPVVFATGKTESDEQAKGLEMGAKGYLTKPVDPEKVLAIVGEVLG